MGLKKIGRSINQKNYAIGLRIAQKYYPRKEKDQSINVFSFDFLSLYFIRLIYVILYLPFTNSKNFSSYFQKRALKHCIPRLFGFYKIRPKEANLVTQYRGLKFLHSEAPQVSIIVNCSDNWINTYNCLNSIIENTKDISYEIILLNTSKTDLSYQTYIEPSIKQFTNLKEANISSLQNSVSDIANGYFLCFLDGNVITNKNWLSNLLQVFKFDTSTSVVIPKLIYPYGLLKSAGNAINKHGCINSIGAFEESSLLKYNTVKEIDCGILTCLLVKKQEFNQFGKFSIEFTNQNYSAADFCYEVRAKNNKKIYYQPLAALIHLKEMQRGNDDVIVFFNKWQKKIQKPYVDTNKKSILIIDAVLPTPDRDSGSRRLFEIIKLFKSLDFNVYFLAHKGSKDDQYYANLINAGITVICPNYLKEPLIKKLPSILPEIDAVWISRPDINEIYGSAIKSIKNIPWLYDTVDLHFIRIKRELELAKIDLATIEEKINPIRTQELKLAKLADCTITVTEVEKDILIKNGVENVSVIPNIHEDQLSNHIVLNFEERKDIIFIGSYNHEPNIDAALWLVNEIMPIVWKENPLIKLTLLGSNPTPEVLALQSEFIRVTGFIHDVSPFFRNARLFVAPLRYGAGMKGKIGQSLEFGLPIVSTNIGIEGMGLENEKNVLVAERAIEFAQNILNLYQTPKLWNIIHQNSIEAIENYTPKNVAKKLQQLINKCNI